MFSEDAEIEEIAKKHNIDAYDCTTLIFCCAWDYFAEEDCIKNNIKTFKTLKKKKEKKWTIT